MAKWAYVQSGAVVELRDALPRNWQNVSGFYLSENDLPFLASHGWLPVIYVASDFDSSTHEITGHTYEVHPTQVIESPVISERSTAAPVDPEPDALSPEVIAREIAQVKWLLSIGESRLAPGMQGWIDQHYSDEKSSWLEKITAVVGQRIATQIQAEFQVKHQGELLEVISQKLIQDYLREFIDRNRVELDRINFETLAALLDPGVDSFLHRLRRERDIRLSATDWSQTPDAQATMDEATRNRWLVYRQALRDVPANFEATGILSWPEF